MKDLNKRNVISKALGEALNKEELHSREAARLLNFHPCYISMVQNPKSWDQIGKTVWSRYEEWFDTHEPLKLFRIPDGEEIWKPKEKAVSDERPAESKKVNKIVNNYTVTKEEIKQKAAEIVNDFETGKKEPQPGDSFIGLKNELYDQPGKKDNHGSIQIKNCNSIAVQNTEIKKAVKNLTKAEPLAVPVPPVIDTQRLKIALDIEINLVINGHRIQL